MFTPLISVANETNNSSRNTTLILTAIVSPIKDVVTRASMQLVSRLAFIFLTKLKIFSMVGLRLSLSRTPTNASAISLLSPRLTNFASSTLISLP